MEIGKASKDLGGASFGHSGKEVRLTKGYEVLVMKPNLIQRVFGLWWTSDRKPAAHGNTI
jgi:hypothetical protein